MCPRTAQGPSAVRRGFPDGPEQQPGTHQREHGEQKQVPSGQDRPLPEHDETHERADTQHQNGAQTKLGHLEVAIHGLAGNPRQRAQHAGRRLAREIRWQRQQRHEHQHSERGLLQLAAAAEGRPQQQAEAERGTADRQMRGDQMEVRNIHACGRRVVLMFSEAAFLRLAGGDANDFGVRQLRLPQNGVTEMVCPRRGSC